MNNRNLHRVLVTFLFLSFLLVSSINISAIDESSKIISEGDWFEYVVLDASITTNAFFGAWPPGINYGNWSVQEGDQIKFQITSIEEERINCSLSLGNYSFVNIRDIDAAAALTLSIYPWNGGFIANASEWDQIELQIKNTNTTQTILDQYQHTINNTLEQFKARIFNTTDYNGQKSLFHYHDETGVLLEASTSFGNYSLNISLISTSFELEDKQGTFSLNFPMFLLIVSVIPITLIFKRAFRLK